MATSVKYIVKIKDEQNPSQKDFGLGVGVLEEGILDMPTTDPKKDWTQIAVALNEFADKSKEKWIEVLFEETKEEKNKKNQ